MTASASDEPFSSLDADPQWAVQVPGSTKDGVKDLAGSFRAGRARPPAPNPDKRPEPAIRSRPRRTTALPPTAADDPELHRVMDAIRAADPDGVRCGRAVRHALDQAYDGRRTGRWDLTQLAKAETAQIGPLIEVWLQRNLDLDDGTTTSLQIGGYDIVCTWSERIDGWTLDRSVPGLGELPYLVIWANDETSRFSVGLLRPGPDSRGVASMDRGRPRLSQVGMDQILWVFDGNALPVNVLMKHPHTAIAAVNESSGQSAVNMLFRRLQGELVQHSAVETVAPGRQRRATRLRDTTTPFRSGHRPAASLRRIISAAPAPSRSSPAARVPVASAPVT
jgi:hypothetical protein